LTGMDARAGYQPFSATHGPSGGFDTGGEDTNPEPPEPPVKKVIKHTQLTLFTNWVKFSGQEFV